jgi:hypothetical protein
MMIMGMTAAAKIAVKPTILYQAAIVLSDNATNNVALLNEKIDKNLDNICVFILVEVS